MSVKGTVLLLEDNLKILDINRRMLENEGVTVLTAENIAQARELIRSSRPDVAVLDIILPDGSGIDFNAEIQTLCETSRAPVYALFLTAKAEREDILAGLSAGGNDYITKPYDIDEFRMRVLGFLRLAEKARNRETDKSRRLSSVLTEKEMTVAALAAKGLYNKEIADKVFLSVSRVKTCLSGIYRKLGISENNNKREILAQIIK